MCLLIASPAGRIPPYDYIKNGFEANPHGAGIAWQERGKVFIEKGIDNHNDLWQLVRIYKNRPKLIHMRFATHGSKTAKNCHPFYMKNGGAMAHNGVIHNVRPKGDRTDSEQFVKDYLDKFDPKDLKNPCVKDLFEVFIGYSKIAMLFKDGSIEVYNAIYGTMVNRIWYSNTTFRAVYSGLKKSESYFNDPFYVSDKYDGILDKENAIW